MYVCRRIKHKNIALWILLTIFTCGIGGFIWFYSLNEDINELSGDNQNISGGMAIMLSIITCGIYTFFWLYKKGKEIDNLKEKYNMRPSNYTGIVYLVLGLIGFTIISYALMQDEINSMIGE